MGDVQVVEEKETHRAGSSKGLNPQRGEDAHRVLGDGGVASSWDGLQPGRRAFQGGQVGTHCCMPSWHHAGGWDPAGIRT